VYSDGAREPRVRGPLSPGEEATWEHLPAHCVAVRSCGLSSFLINDYVMLCIWNNPHGPKLFGVAVNNILCYVIQYISLLYFANLVTYFKS